MSKYAFCDLDYTLLNDYKEISSDNIKAIKEFEDKGNHFIICTGRVPYVMKKYSDLLNSKDIVCANGGIIIIDNKEVKTCSLDRDVVKAVIEYAFNNSLHARIFSNDKLYVLNRPENDPLATQLYDGYMFVTKDNVFDAIKDVSIIKIIICDDNKDHLSNAYDYINNLNLNTELTYSSACFLEVNSSGQRKGNGIIEYCKLKGVDIKDTIAIGDNDNDISMFEVTGLSGCPSNAIDRVKGIVNYVSPKDYNNSAVADILKHYEK